MGLSCGTRNLGCIVRDLASQRADSQCSEQTLNAVRGFSGSTACGIFVPGPGIEHLSPLLHSGFLPTGQAGKSSWLD